MTVRARLSALQGRGLRQVAGRAGWNFADQAVSSATNMVLSLLAARALSVDGFGAFSVAFTIYTFLISGGRSLISRPLAVRFAAASQAEFRTAASATTGATVVLGIVSGVVVAAVGLSMSGDLGTSLLCMGVLLPGLLLQDAWRVVFTTEGRPSAAFVNDLVWGLVQIGLVVAVLAADRESAVTVLLAWGGAALVAAVLGCIQFRGLPRVLASAGWMRDQRDLLKYYFASFITIMGANQLTLLLIAALGTAADVGALRAAQVVLGPLNLVGYALSAFAIPEISRRKLSGRRAVQAAGALSAVLVAANLVWGGIMLALPDRVGVALLGDSWEAAQSVLPATLVGLVAIAAGFGASSLLVALGYAKETFRINCLLAPGFLVFGLGGLELWGAPGAALGLSLAQVVVAPAIWWRVVVLMRGGSGDGRPPAGGPGAAQAPALDRA